MTHAPFWPMAAGTSTGQVRDDGRAARTWALTCGYFRPTGSQPRPVENPRHGCTVPCDTAVTVGGPGHEMGGAMCTSSASDTRLPEGGASDEHTAERDARATR